MHSKNKIFIFHISDYKKKGYLHAGFAALGVTAGAHRLWSHNGYKAKWQLKVIWLYLNTMAFQNSVWEWARDHRLKIYCQEKNKEIQTTFSAEPITNLPTPMATRTIISVASFSRTWGG